MVLRFIESSTLPTKWGTFDIHGFEDPFKGKEHIAITIGDCSIDEPLAVRIHSECLTGDALGSLRCDCGEQLKLAMQKVEKEGKGIILYMNQEGRGIGFLNKIRAYKLQEEGYDTVEANEKLGFKPDERDYGIGAQILHDLNVSNLRLMTNNPKKRAGLIGYGLKIVENVALEIKTNEHNSFYLKTKKDKMGHDFNI